MRLSGSSRQNSRLRPNDDELTLSTENARVVAEMSSAALVGNYRAIQEQAQGLAMLPMIKANAYGHGEAWAAKLLASQPGLYGLGVATLEEGASVRQAITLRNRKLRVIVFSGVTPWSEEKGNYCEQLGLSPVIASDADWLEFHRGGWHKKLAYELKFNTGMNRLGITASLASKIAQTLKSELPEAHPHGVMSHLAMSEDPDSPVSRKQLDAFQWLRGEMHAAVPSAQFHLANSGAIWNSKYWRLKELTDLVRPGLSLYGVPPWKGAPERGLVPVMTLKARVVTVQRLKPGETIGYGATYKVTGNDPVFAAVLSAGYADGIKRMLSNGGHAWLLGEGGGQATRFLGTISMDLCAVEATAKTRVGDWVEILGPHVDAWGQARAASTIPYELLTSVSPRVKRTYE